MSNLTKYDVLKHRHLSLLKALEDKGVTAHYSQQDGEWQITKADEPRGFVVTGLNNTQLAEHLLRHSIEDATAVPDYLTAMIGNEVRPPKVSTINNGNTYTMRNAAMEDIVNFICVRQMKGGQLLSEVCRVMGLTIYGNGQWTFSPVSFRIGTDWMTELTPDHVVQRYSQEWWGQKANGEFVYVRDANEQVPQWVRDAERKFCVFPAEFNGFKVTVDQGNNKIFYTVGSSRVPEKVVDATPVLTHLLAAISSAIVAASPAKVD